MRRSTPCKSDSPPVSSGLPGSVASLHHECSMKSGGSPVAVACTRPAIGDAARHHLAMGRQAAKTGHAAHLHGRPGVKAAPKRSLLQRTRSHQRRHRKHREAHSRSAHHRTRHHSTRHGHVRPGSTKPTLDLGGAANRASGQHGPMLAIVGLVCCAAVARAVGLWWVAVRNSWKLWTSKLEQIFIALFVPCLRRGTASAKW